jgi:hypothetical protein
LKNKPRKILNGRNSTLRLLKLNVDEKKPRNEKYQAGISSI